MKYFDACDEKANNRSLKMSDENVQTTEYMTYGRHDNFAFF